MHDYYRIYKYTAYLRWQTWENSAYLDQTITWHKPGVDSKIKRELDTEFILKSTL